MSNRLFTDHELNQLATPYPDRIVRLIESQQIGEASTLTEEMADSRILLHDFFADSCTILWSFVGDRLGEDCMDEMFRYVFNQSAKRQFFDAAGAQVMPHLSVYLLSKSWRAHSCFARGDHPGQFSISEDDEKFTFHLHPCGSGARLKMKGWYEPEKGGKLSENSHPWTYNRNRFPYYCIHCPYLNEILPYESSYSALLWPVDPPDNDKEDCAWHLYKDPNDIPVSYYKRLGLVKKPVTAGTYAKPKKRFFSDNQLKEMARPVTDRIIEQLSAGDLKAALSLCRDVKDEFLVLHDLYVNMLAATFAFIFMKGGEEMAGIALARQYDLCIHRQLAEPLRLMPVKEQAIFLANHIFGTDCCNGTGYNPGKFSIRETDKEIIFTLAPCGSGGRLLRATQNRIMRKIQHWREEVETAVITFIAQRIPLSEALVRHIFPYMVTHFTQRKPVTLKTTRKSHPWSFNQSGISLYCCQCGIVQEKLGIECLKIQPPVHKKDPCIWKLSKKTA